MIYAIKCGKWVKIGRAIDVQSRLRDLQIGNPYKLKLLAVANWPDAEESAIHTFLAPHHHQGEWFKDSVATRKIIEYLLDEREGYSYWNTVARLELAYRAGWIPPRREEYVRQKRTELVQTNDPAPKGLNSTY